MDLELVRGRLEERRLAGDERAGSWTRAENRRRIVRFVRRGWVRLVVMGLTAGGVISAASVMVPPGFARGLFVGVTAAIAASAIALIVRDCSGASASSMGAVAEQWTASELRPLGKQGWTLINHFLLDNHGDFDHLLVGPAGVVLVETKWTANGWNERWARERERDAIERLQKRAAVVGAWLGQKDRVLGVLFEWGRGPDDSDSDSYAIVGGVTVIRGRRSAQYWRSKVNESPRRLTPAETSNLVKIATKHVVGRDDYDARAHPAPPSLDRILGLTLGSLIAGILGILAILEPTTQVGPWFAIPVGLAAAAVGVAGRRSQRWRLAADAWLAGIGATAVLVSVVLATA